MRFPLLLLTFLAGYEGLAQTPPSEPLVKHWPVQTRAQTGLSQPQDPATLPHSSAPLAVPVAKPVVHVAVALPSRGPFEWALAGAWFLIEAGKVKTDGGSLSAPGASTDGWLDATVPGTVLTTMVDRGIYPDPDYGLNNLAIPESLNKKDYWYRTEFTPDESIAGRHLELCVKGINYAAVVWLNGKLLGTVRGAFTRGVFDVTGLITPGRPNALAVLISPPPHPGIAHEQSVKAGPGDNGGMLCLDGPTFICTEGWDWIPGIRDRNTGIWQEITLTATGPVKIDDAHVVTRLPLPDTSHAEIRITVPLRNQTAAPVQGTLEASFEGVTLNKPVTLAPGESSVTLFPGEFPQLAVSNPRLWWPNGYGSPALYHLSLSFLAGNKESDSKKLRFGIREITYELSLGTPTGRLQRVEYSPTQNTSGEAVINVTHEGTFQTKQGWVESLREGAEHSPAIRTIDDLAASPYLVVKVNGARIAVRGGNWGMEDSRKRVSRERLEPYFRLHRDAHFNLIRNWCGQNTEEAFYDLADEYGLLVWNDFWDSTQNYNLEPDDSALFLANARDTIARYRNHPSIAMWCGRNEGVPSPVVNEGLDSLVRELDGTRHYMASSNVINLQNSGPYKYQDPVGYFTKFGKGFAVELGIPSVPTLDSLKSFLPEPDRWPPNDTWAYHDWHQGGNGDVAPFMDAMREEFGAPTSLEDFERKAQMLNYDLHRALFEGFNAHLWAPNSGRLMWMSQPAWPSTVWQLFTSDYDTQASFYGAQKASEPVHVQMNLPDLKTAVINNGLSDLRDLRLSARVFSIDGKQMWTHEEKLNAAANSATDGFAVDSGQTALGLVKLELRDSSGALVSDNFYWHGARASDLQALNTLSTVDLAVSAKRQAAGEFARVTVTLANRSQTPALMTKVTLRNASDGSRVLPAYLNSNYVSLLPGETKTIAVEYPAAAAKGNVAVGISGWNVRSATITPD